MALLDRLVCSLGKLLNGIGALILLPALTLMMTADVVLRYVFNAPLSWGLEASTLLLLVLFLSGLVEAFRNGAHIRMDLVYRNLPDAGKRIVTLIYCLLAIGTFLLVARKGFEEAHFLLGISQVTQYLHIPQWIFYAAIALVATLFVLFFLLRGIAVLFGQRIEVEDEHQHFEVE
jgi:C4-dicarboxylate transporter DctQ subunit